MYVMMNIGGWAEKCGGGSKDDDAMRCDVLSPLGAVR